MDPARLRWPRVGPCTQVPASECSRNRDERSWGKNAVRIQEVAIKVEQRVAIGLEKIRADSHCNLHESEEVQQKLETEET